MKIILFMFGVFASYKWYTNYMAFIAMVRYLESIGDDGPSKEEFERLISDELNYIFKRKGR